MKRYNITVRTLTEYFSYTAIAANSWDAYEHAIDQFGTCGVTVRPL